MRAERPILEDLYERAHTYYRDVYQRTGSPPERFVITHEEYLLLLRYHQPYLVRDMSLAGEIRMFGMLMVHSESARSQMVSAEVVSWIREVAQRGGLNPSVDSEQSSFETWAAGVEALVEEVKRKNLLTSVEIREH